MSAEQIKIGFETFWKWIVRMATVVIIYLASKISARFESYADQIQLLRTDIEVIKNTGAKSVDIEVLKTRVSNIETRVTNIESQIQTLDR